MQFLEALIELNCFSHCDVQLNGGNLNLKWPNLLLWRYAAESLVLGLSVEAKAYPQVALLFGHISNFSQLIDHNSAEQVHAVLCLFCDQLKGVVVVVQHCVPLVFCFFFAIQVPAVVLTNNSFFFVHKPRFQNKAFSHVAFRNAVVISFFFRRNALVSKNGRRWNAPLCGADSRCSRWLTVGVEKGPPSPLLWWNQVLSVATRFTICCAAWPTGWRPSATATASTSSKRCTTRTWPPPGPPSWRPPTSPTRWPPTPMSRARFAPACLSLLPFSFVRAWIHLGKNFKISRFFTLFDDFYRKRLKKLVCLQIRGRCYHFIHCPDGVIW